MKKIAIINIIFCILFVTGCGCEKKEELQINQCTNTADNGNFLYNVEYKFESDNESNLISYKRIEKYTSDDEEFLNGMKEYKQSYFEKFDEIENFKYNIDISGKELNTELIIDFSKIDKEKLLEIESFYLNFLDENDSFDVNYAMNFYIGEEMTCS